MKRSSKLIACLSLSAALAFGMVPASAFAANADAKADAAQSTEKAQVAETKGAKDVELKAQEATAKDANFKEQYVYFGYPWLTSARLVNGTSIELKWDAANNAQGYYVKRATSASGSYATIATLGAGATSYTNTGLPKGATYYYKIVAFAKDGANIVEHESSYRKMVTVTAATNITKLERAGSQIRINFTPVSGAEGYLIMRSTKKNAGFTQVSKTYTTSGYYFDYAPQIYGTYYYKVIPFVENYSSATGYVVTNGPESAAVQTLGQGYLKSTKVMNKKKRIHKFTWAKVPGATGYYIQRSTKLNSGYKTVKTVKASTTSYKTPALKGKTTYYYKIVPYVKSGKKVTKALSYNYAKFYVGYF